MLFIIITLFLIVFTILIKIYIDQFNTFLKTEGNCELNYFLRPFLVLGIICSAKDNEDTIKRMYMILKKNASGASVGVRLGILPTFWIYDPDHVKFIMRNPATLDKGFGCNLGEGWIDHGLFTAPLPIWQRHRKVLQGILKLVEPNSIVAMFNKCSREIIEKISKYDGGKEFDVIETTLTSFFGTTFEHVCGIYTTEEERIKLSLVAERVGLNATQRVCKVWLRPRFIYNLTKLGKMNKELGRYFNSFTIKAIAVRKQILAEQKTYLGSSSNTSKTNENTIGFMDCMLDHMLENEFKFEEDQLRAELNTLVLAGYDTTAHTFAFVLFVLANYPEIQEKVYKEIFEIYGNSSTEENPTTATDITRMEYMERVIKETMRFFTVLGVVLRYATQSVQMGEIYIAKGSHIFVFLDYMHRSEKYWPEALEFEPDRFIPGHPLNPRNRFAFAPFASGPRNCLGSKYAFWVLKTVLTNLLRKFVFKTKCPQRASELKVKNGVATLPRDPIMLYVERRQTSTQ